MPRILERLVRKLQSSGHDKSSAYAIATASLQKNGYIERGSQKLTKKSRQNRRNS